MTTEGSACCERSTCHSTTGACCAPTTAGRMPRRAWCSCGITVRRRPGSRSSPCSPQPRRAASACSRTDARRYGGSSPRPGRDVASAAADVAAVADAFGVERFAAMGASGGAPHALAGAALLPDRVTGVVTLAGIAPAHRRVRLVRRHARAGWTAGRRCTAARRVRATRRRRSSTPSSSCRSTSRRSRATGRRSATTSRAPTRSDPTGSSTTTWRSPGRGGSSSRTSGRRCCSCRARATASCRGGTRRGCSAACRTPRSGCGSTTATSRCSTPCPTRWTGCSSARS